MGWDFYLFIGIAVLFLVIAKDLGGKDKKYKLKVAHSKHVIGTKN